MRTTTTKMSSLRPGKKLGIKADPNATLVGIYNGRKNGKMTVEFAHGATRSYDVKDVILEAVPTWATLSDPKYARPTLPKKPTKADLVLDIVRGGLNMNYKPKDIIACIMKEANMSKVGASTYYYTAKKKVG